MSMDWFKGRFTGTPMKIFIGNRWFPVKMFLVKTNPLTGWWFQTFGVFISYMGCHPSQ